MKKYRVTLTYKSGHGSFIEVENYFEARVVVQAFKEEYNIERIGVLELINGKWEFSERNFKY